MLVLSSDFLFAAERSAGKLGRGVIFLLSESPARECTAAHYFFMHSSSIPTERWLWVYNGRAASGKQSPGPSPRFGHHYPHLHAGSIVFVIFTLICAHHAFFLFVLLFFYLSFSPFEGVVLRLSLRTPWSGGAGAGRLLGRTAKFNHLRTRSNQASKASGTKTSRRRRRRTRHCTAGGGEEEGERAPPHGEAQGRNGVWEAPRRKGKKGGW